MPVQQMLRLYQHVVALLSSEYKSVCMYSRSCVCSTLSACTSSAVEHKCMAVKQKWDWYQQVLLRAVVQNVAVQQKSGLYQQILVLLSAVLQMCMCLYSRSWDGTSKYFYYTRCSGTKCVCACTAEVRTMLVNTCTSQCSFTKCVCACTAEVGTVLVNTFTILGAVVQNVSVAYNRSWDGISGTKCVCACTAEVVTVLANTSTVLL